MTYDETLPSTRPESVSAAAQGKRGTGTYSLYRDPFDVRTVIQLARSGIVLSVLLLVSVAGNFYQYYRRPDRIVVDKSSGRVVEINDRDYGETETVQLGPEHLTDADKKYIASEFIRSLYQIDPATRSKDLERALRMMVPDSALKFARYLKQDNVLDKQLQESWQSTWTAQDITIDTKDRYAVRVLGRQDIHRLDNGATMNEPRQLSLSLKLIADPKGRADRNLPQTFTELETRIWRHSRTPDFGEDGRSLSMANYYYIYYPVDSGVCTLWAIPINKRREEASTFFLAVSPETVRRWKGAPLVFDEIKRLPSLPEPAQLALLGLTEQQPIQLQPSQGGQKASTAGK